MNLPGVASLTGTLLVVKGAAAPSRPVAPPPRRHPQRNDGRVRVPLRIDEARHRRLRLAAAHFHKSAQAVMLAALDNYLDRIVPNALDEHCQCICGHKGDDKVVPLVPRAP